MKNKLLKIPVTELLTSHITKGGSLYIPRELGGVQVNVEDSDKGFTITLTKVRSPWKRYVYIGQRRVKKLFEAVPYTSYPVEFVKCPLPGDDKLTAKVVNY